MTAPPGDGAAPVPEDPLVAGDAGAKVIRGSGLRAAANIIGVLTGAVSAPLVVRHLGVEGYGKLALVNSVVFVAVALTEGGLAQVAIRRYATADEQERRRLIRALLGLRVLLSVIAGAGVIAYAFLLPYPNIVEVGIMLGAVAILFNNLWGAWHTALVAQLRLTAVAGLEITRALSTTALFVLLVVLGADLGPFYLVAPGAAFVTLLATGIVAHRTGIPLLPRVDLTRWTGLARETALYAAATALGATYFQLALVITALLTDERETGLYAIAFRIVEIVNAVPFLLASSVFPVLAHAAANDPQRLRYAVGRVTETALIGGAGVLLVMILGAKFGLQVVAGSAGPEAVTVLRITALGVMASFLVAAWGFVLLSRQRYKALLIANAGAFVLAITLSLVLIPAFGAEGSGAVTACLEISLAIAYGVAVARELPGLGAGLHLAPRLALAVAAAFAVGLPLLLVHPVPATIAGGLAYVGVLALLRAIPPELLDAVRRRAA